MQCNPLSYKSEPPLRHLCSTSTTPLQYLHSTSTVLLPHLYNTSKAPLKYPSGTSIVPLRHLYNTSAKPVRLTTYGLTIQWKKCGTTSSTFYGPESKRHHHQMKYGHDTSRKPTMGAGVVILLAGVQMVLQLRAALLASLQYRRRIAHIGSG